MKNMFMSGGAVNVTGSVGNPRSYIILSANN